MASQLPIERLIELGYELCGTYALQETPDEEGNLLHRQTHAEYNAHPLTTPEKLAAFLARAAGFKGVKQARRALRYILPASASPMESKLTMLLCLPHNLGGYAIIAPQLNHRVDLPKHLKRKFSHGYFKCDLYWEHARLAIEYDSDLAHSGVNKTISDAMRRSTIEVLGVTVLSVTRPQVYNAEALNKLAHVVAKKTGTRLQYVDPGFTRRHRRLRDLLLFS